MTEEQNTSKLQSEELAGLIVDSLYQAGLIDPEKYEFAVAVVTEEINARKAVNDY